MVIQQTPYQGLWNCFRLVTSLSYNDLLTQYSSIGFWKDNALSFTYEPTLGTQNNNNYIQANSSVSGASQYEQNNGNDGFLKRQMAFAYNNTTASPYTSQLLYSQTSLNQVYKSQIFQSVVNGTSLLWQQQIVGTVYLKHLHSFFDKVCLLKGVLMRLTLNLNQSSVSFTVSPSSSGGGNTYSNISVTSPLGGVSPLMIANGGANAAGGSLAAGNYTLSLAVGQFCLNTNQKSLAQNGFVSSIQLIVPAYTFAPMFETAYLSSPIKKIIYSDIYQYSVPSIGSNQVFNQLVTNGIANIKSILLIPFFVQAGTSFTGSPILSPLDTAGGGTSSPYCLLGNFQVQISGANMLYNQYQYTYNEWLQQLYGCNSVNGGQTDGISSGLISQLDFETMYNYYYVDCSRMLSIEEMVPKSVQILGQNLSSNPITLFIFVNYGVEISIEILTGARI